MKKLLMTALCAVALASTVNMGFAGEPPRANKGPSPEARQEHMQKRAEHQQQMDERLKLTPEQKALAEKNRQEGRAKMEPVMKEMRAKKEQLRALKESGKSEAEIQKQAEPIKKDLRALKEKANKMREDNMKSFEAILTPEQKTEFAKMKEEGKARRAEFEKNGGPRGPHGGPEGKRPCGGDCEKKSLEKKSTDKK